jgi:hypothetical protein
MKKFNLFKEIITVNTDEFKKAVESQSTFAINTDGEILTRELKQGDMIIFHGSAYKDEKLEDSLGPKYQIVIAEERTLIKAFSNWQEIISFNTPLASYDDTTADGVAEFSNKELEDIGWQATEFDISYRELVELLEDKVDGTVLCIEQEDPYQFSGFGFIANDEQAKEVMFKYCQEKAKDKLENDDDFKEEYLEDDQLEAKEFFKL